MELKFLDPRLGQFNPSTDLSAGYDLRCCEDNEVVILPGQTVKVKTGVSIYMSTPTEGHEMEAGHMINFCGVIMPRSGLGCKGLRPRNVPGLIDADYQGEIILCMYNETDDFITIQPMDRIAQLVFMLSIQPKFMVVTNFSNETDRGVGGFGSTGKQ